MVFGGEDPPKVAGAAQRSGVGCRLVPTPNILPGSVPGSRAVLPVHIATELLHCTPSSLALLTWWLHHTGTAGIAAIVYPKTELWLLGVPQMIFM